MDPSPARPRLTAVALGIAALVLMVDQATKTLAINRLIPNVPVPAVDGWLQWRLVRNPGAAFSLSTGTTWLFTLIAVVVAIVVVRISRRLGSWPWAVGLGLLLGGAMGNLVDRLLRQPGFARGHVVDFIEYLRFPVIDFPVFNIADSSIVVSALLIALLGLREVPLEGRRPDHAADTAGPADPAGADDA